MPTACGPVLSAPREAPHGVDPQADGTTPTELEVAATEVVTDRDDEETCLDPVDSTGWTSEEAPEEPTVAHTTGRLGALAEQGYLVVSAMWPTLRDAATYDRDMRLSR